MPQLARRMWALFWGLLLAGSSVAVPSAPSQLGAGVGDDAVVAELRSSNFIQVPGPNPILRSDGGAAKWPGAGTMMEFGDVFKDFDTYYLYTHAGHFDDGYEIGVATAPTPTGPWTLRDDVNPILQTAQLNEKWNSHTAGVACACMVKRGVASDLDTAPDYFDSEDHSKLPLGGNHTYLLYYCGTDGSATAGWNMGVATAPHPLGPFAAWKGNPLVPKSWPDANRTEGLYPSQVLNVDGSYLMYGEAILTPAHGAGMPELTTSVPLGGIGIWKSDIPEGPFLWAGFADLPDYWGGWDDGGSSSGAVTVHGGVFEMWYDGAKLRAQGAKDIYAAGSLGRWESVGAAYSTNGVNFSKNVHNPIVRSADQPSVPQISRNTATSLSECKMLYEHPYRESMLQHPQHPQLQKPHRSHHRCQACRYRGLLTILLTAAACVSIAARRLCVLHDALGAWRPRLDLLRLSRGPRRDRPYRHPLHCRRWLAAANDGDRSSHRHEWRDPTGQHDFVHRGSKCSRCDAEILRPICQRNPAVGVRRQRVAAHGRV
jgi:hypothetical protein